MGLKLKLLILFFGLASLTFAGERHQFTGDLPNSYRALEKFPDFPSASTPLTLQHSWDALAQVAVLGHPVRDVGSISQGALQQYSSRSVFALPASPAPRSIPSPSLAKTEPTTATSIERAAPISTQLSAADQELMKDPFTKQLSPLYGLQLPLELGALALTLIGFLALRKTSWRFVLLGLALLLFFVARTINPIHQLKSEIQTIAAHTASTTTYIRPGVQINIKDVYGDSTSGYANPKGALSAEDIASIKHYLDLIPSAHLRFATLGNFPLIQQGALRFGISESGVAIPRQADEGIYGVVLDRLTPDSWLDVMGHEIGHLVQFDVLSEDEKKSWISLFNRSTNSTFDFVDSYTFQKPLGHPIVVDAPYGSINLREDFASVYGNWLHDSEGLLEEAVRRAELGHSILLEKVLFIAALFSDGQGATFGYHSGSQLTRSSLIFRQDSTSIRLGSYLFAVNSQNAISGLLRANSQNAITLSDLGFGVLPEIDPDLSVTFAQNFNVPLSVTNRIVRKPEPSSPSVESLALSVPVTQIIENGDTTVAFRDGYTDPRQHFSDAEQQILRALLQAVPEDHLNDLQYVATIPNDDPNVAIRLGDQGLGYLLQSDENAGTPYSALNPAHVVASGSESPTTQAFVFSRASAYALGAFALSHQFKGRPSDIWNVLYEASSKNPNVANDDYFSSFPAFGNQDFAMSYAGWMQNSALYLRYGSTLVQQKRSSILFQKVLLMASLFADPTTHTIELPEGKVLGEDSYQFDTKKISYEMTDDHLTLFDVPSYITPPPAGVPQSTIDPVDLSPANITFQLKDGRITSVQIGDRTPTPVDVATASGLLDSFTHH